LYPVGGKSTRNGIKYDFNIIQSVENKNSKSAL
jgi:hypothetical protein